MDTARAVMNAAAATAQGKAQMVFDWDRAAKLIVESGCKTASAGLTNDWEWTGGVIFRDGKPVPKDETYTYLSSHWAPPQLSINGGLMIECWVSGDAAKDWDAHTYWPESALLILAGPSERPDGEPK